MTPHSGEMAKFLDLSRERVDSDPLGAARRAAGALEAIVAMKGASTHIVSPDGEACLSENGSIGLATSGSGDTLAGILAGLVARGTRPYLAVAWAVYLHGEAGRRLASRDGTFGLLAREIPVRFRQLCKSSPTAVSLERCEEITSQSLVCFQRPRSKPSRLLVAAAANELGDQRDHPCALHAAHRHGPSAALGTSH